LTKAYFCAIFILLIQLFRRLNCMAGIIFSVITKQQVRENMTFFSANHDVSIYSSIYGTFFLGKIIKISPLFIKIEFSRSLQEDLLYQLVGESNNFENEIIRDFKENSTLEFDIAENNFTWTETRFKKNYELYGISPD
jgi:hypothetical protein